MIGSAAMCGARASGVKTVVSDMHHTRLAGNTTSTGVSLHEGDRWRGVHVDVGKVDVEMVLA